MTQIPSRRRRTLLSAGLAIAMGSTLPHAHSADMVRFVLPFPPGGTTDNLARLIAASMTAAGQPVMVENKPGGNGVIAVQAVLQSPADGRTLLFTPPSPVAANVALFKLLPYDPRKDLAPVASLFKTHMVLVAHASGAYRTVADLKAASAAGKSISFAAGSPGYGLVYEQMRKESGIQAMLVNYKGTVAALQDVAGGTVDIAIADPVAVYPLVQAGKLRALAVFDEVRDDKLPAVPTSAEAGAGRPAFYQWLAVFARTGTPPEVLAGIRRHLRTAVHDKALMETARKNSLSPFWGDAESLRALQHSEIDLFQSLMASAGLEPQ